MTKDDRVETLRKTLARFDLALGLDWGDTGLLDDKAQADLALDSLSTELQGAKEPHYLPLPCPMCGRNRLTWNPVTKQLACEKHDMEWDDTPQLVAEAEANFAARTELQETRREHDLAVAHDRQPYPTADAYEKVCAALDRKTTELQELREALIGDGSAERIAELFHEEYERLAPSFGYETRPESAKPWSDVPERNRLLMAATVHNVLSAALSHQGKREDR